MIYILASAIAAILFYPVWVVHRQTLGSHEKVERSPAEWGAEFENISYVTDDGLTLRGWFIPADGRKAVLLMHGNGGNRNGYTSGIFDLGRWYREQGYSVMMVDLRAHGESEGERIYFGVKESADMLGWLSRVDGSGRFTWSLHGFSMGAATALMMKEREPRRFEKVVADAPWIDFELLSKRELWRRADLPPLFYGYTKLVAKLFFDIEFKEADNRLRCRKLCKEPILYIFESEDTLVTKEHIGRLREACPDVEIAIFEKAGHVEAFKEMPERYTETVSRFLKSVKR